MASWRVFATIVVGVAILGAMILREPTPEGATSPYKLKLALFISRCYMDYAVRIATTLGFSTDITMRRYAFNKKLTWTAPGVKMEDLTLEGVSVRFYYPPEEQDDDVASGLLPGIVYYHGGGWVLGDLDTHAHVCSRLSRDTGAIVLAINYRLGPEVDYTAVWEDNVKVTRMFLEKARDFGVDAKRIALAGDSAGGQLALTVSLRMRDLGVRPQPKLMVSIYPVTQALDLTLPAYQQYPEGPWLLRNYMGWFFSYIFLGNATKAEEFLQNKHVPRDVRNKMAATYINHDNIPSDLRYPPYQRPSLVGDDVTVDESLWEAIKDRALDPYFSPLLAEDLSGLPETVLYAGKNDVLRDDGILMAQRLKDAGVSVHLIVDPLGWHGCWASFLRDKDANDSATNIIENIKQRL